MELKILISLILGAIIGLEREAYVTKADVRQEDQVGSLGVRTFMLITPLGCITALLYPAYMPIALVLFACFLLLIIAYFVTGSIMLKDNGLTTEFAIIWSYILGLIVGLNLLSVQSTIALTVCLIIILYSKKKIRTLALYIQDREFEGFLGYALIALVILPFLPDRAILLGQIPGLATLVTQVFGVGSAALGFEILNPFAVWKIIVLITGIEMAGYVLQKVVGSSHGIFLSSLTGGFISSTSTTISLANESRKNTSSTNILVAAAVLANFASFLQIMVLIAGVNILLLQKAWVFVVVLSVAAVAVAIYWIKTSKKHIGITNMETDNSKPIFSLLPAVQFAAIYLVVKIVTNILLAVFGEGGFIVGSMIAAFTGLDAVTINISQVAGSTIALSTALLTLAMANAVNLFAKTWYSKLQGSSEFAYKFFVSVCVMVMASLVAILFA